VGTGGHPRGRARYLAIMSAVGVLFLAVFVAWDWAHGTPPHLSLAFTRDFIVNNHGISREVTDFLCLEVRSMAARRLQTA